MSYEKIQYKEIFDISNRLKIIIYLVIGFFVIIFLRLIYLQVFEGIKYRDLANINSIRVIQKRASRGNILDRYGNKLVYNIPYYNVIVIPADLKNKDLVLSKLSKILKINEEEIRIKLDKVKNNTALPVAIKENLDSRVAGILEEEKQNLNGVLIIVEPKRSYIEDGLFHTVGYVSEVNDMEVLLNSEYFIGDLIGRIGIEKEYDKFLRGVNGRIRMLVDAAGRKFKLAGSSEPVKGKDIVLTLDSKLQKVAESSLKGRTGSIIVMNPNSGDILAIVSSPSPSLKKFSFGLTKDEWEKLSNDSEHPLHNRAISAMYAFGSTFKVLTAIAGLEKAVIDEKTRFFCNGIFWFSTWDYRCWKREGHGSVDIYRALTESCDVYFYNVGLRLGIENLSKFAFYLGLGEKTGIDINGEKDGLVPTPKWKEEKEGTPWFPGNTIQLSIGQGYILATPIQMLSLFNIIVTDGKLYRPHVILEKSEPKVIRDVKFNTNNLRIIKKGLLSVVNSEKGTGKNARINGINVAGKTATIENPHGKTHAAFIAFAPAESPVVSLIVFLEQGGEGGADAAPIAKKILESYFKDERIN